MLHHSTALRHKTDVSRKCSNRSVLSCLLSCPEILAPFNCFSAFNAGDSIKKTNQTKPNKKKRTNFLFSATTDLTWYLFPPEAATVTQPWWKSIMVESTWLAAEISVFYWKILYFLGVQGSSEMLCQSQQLDILITNSLEMRDTLMTQKCIYAVQAEKKPLVL